MNQQILQKLSTQQLKAYKDTLHRRIDDLKLFNLQIGRDNMRLAEEYRVTRDIATRPTPHIKNFDFDFDDLYKIGKNKISSWMHWGGNSSKKKADNNNVIDSSNNNNNKNQEGLVGLGLGSTMTTTTSKTTTAPLKNYQFDDLPSIGWNKLKKMTGFGKGKGSANKQQQQQLQSQSQQYKQKPNQYARQVQHQNPNNHYNENQAKYLQRQNNQFQITHSHSPRNSQQINPQNQSAQTQYTNYKPLYHPGMQRQQLQNSNKRQSVLSRPRQKIFDENYQNKYQKINTHISRLKHQLHNSQQNNSIQSKLEQRHQIKNNPNQPQYNSHKSQNTKLEQKQEKNEKLLQQKSSQQKEKQKSEAETTVEKDKNIQINNGQI